MNKRGGNGRGNGEVEDVTDVAEIVNVIMAGTGKR